MAALSHGGSSSNSHTREPEPMHIGRTRLSPEERARRRQGNLCLYCGQAGHFISRCPAKGHAVVPQPSRCFSTPPDLTGVPTEYLDFREVFNKAKATSLPPHRPSDCAIDLQPGTTTPPRGRLYSLSAPEREAMEAYINDSLAAGIIRPSSSPAGAGFFFVEKKDKTLRPCIDYRGMNDITIKNRYPLPLISSAFELLDGATIFTKLDLRNAYHLVRIRDGDEWKTAFNTPTGHYEYLVMPFGLTNAPSSVPGSGETTNKEEHVHHVQAVLQRLLENSLFVKAEKCEFHASSVSFLGFIVGRGSLQMDPAKVSAVASWPTPSSRKQLQWFLGFANFYRRFIRGYSTVAAPLTALTSSKVTFSVVCLAANEAFNTLKTRFTSAPILIMPDPERQFVLEVDASDVGVGAVLSQQRSSEDQKLHPCAFFSKRLSPAERNYDIGNRELLAVKLALEEWRHWLEGSKQPFLVWTRPQEPGIYSIRQETELLPGPVFQRDEDVAPCPDTIISSSHLVAPLTWEIEERVKAAHRRVNLAQPSACPQNRLFVPPSLRSDDVLQWAHSSRLTCHPGIQRTIDVVRQRFWWATMNEDTRGFVKACPVQSSQVLPPRSCRSPAAPCLCPVVPGLTSLWTSSLACHHPMATPPS
ncbi:hypothetical protein L3Q82_014740 [Scortum barcoo]|uniref:Uncharacterized protein n=1 Tax=Scortum barcoo TaxID=214431 RepID=A0ACB8VTZ9_9TELE|nr:hypothetical protein L3Q82_014740 [Scortum barcoo]